MDAENQRFRANQIEPDVDSTAPLSKRQLSRRSLESATDVDVVCAESSPEYAGHPVSKVGSISLERVHSQAADSWYSVDRSAYHLDRTPEAALVNGVQTPDAPEGTPAPLGPASQRALEAPPKLSEQPPFSPVRHSAPPCLDPGFLSLATPRQSLQRSPSAGRELCCRMRVSTAWCGMEHVLEQSRRSSMLKLFGSSWCPSSAIVKCRGACGAWQSCWVTPEEGAPRTWRRRRWRMWRRCGSGASGRGWRSSAVRAPLLALCAPQVSGSAHKACKLVLHCRGGTHVGGV